jgi:hypothetical protein
VVVELVLTMQTAHPFMQLVEMVALVVVLGTTIIPVQLLPVGKVITEVVALQVVRMLSLAVVVVELVQSDRPALDQLLVMVERVSQTQ